MVAILAIGSNPFWILNTYEFLHFCPPVFSQNSSSNFATYCKNADERKFDCALKTWVHPIVLVLSPNCQLTLCPIEANNAWKAYYHHLTVRESKSVSVQILPEYQSSSQLLRLLLGKPDLKFLKSLSNY